MHHAVVTSLLVLLASSVVHAESTDEIPLKHISLQLKWKHQFQFAGFYAALEKGYYRDAGYQVDLRPAGPGINPIDEVLEGKADYGLANSELLLYHMNGEPVVALAAIIQHSPIVLMTLKKNNYSSPQDLIGKRVMYPSGHYGANTLGLFLKEGISQSQFESVPLSYNINDLIEEKVDAMVGYVTDQPFQLSQKGVDYSLIDPRVYGIDFYGDVLFSTHSKLEEHNEEVRAIMQASLEGWRYAVNNSEEIISLIKSKYQSELSLEELRYEAQATIRLIVPKLVDLGHMNPGRWEHIAKTFSELGMAEGKLNVEKFIFDPDKNEASLLTRQAIQVTSIITLIGLILISFLFYFNKQLKRAVNEKTIHLTKANRELIVYTKQLKVKEDELQALNAQLEKRIIARTETINKVNYELSEEINQRKKREVSLQLLSQAIESSDTIVLIIDKNHIISYASKAFMALTGSTNIKLEGQPISILENRLSLPTIATKDLSSQDLAPNTEGLIESRLKFIDAEDRIHWMKTSISLLKGQNHQTPAEISHYVITFDDITDIQNHSDELERMALYDPLTGLENRVLFQKRLESAIQNAKRSMLKTALLFIDIDNFKAINDSLGHLAGDEILKTIASRLSDHVRQNDSIARISGDEFTVLLSDIKNYEDASKVTQSIFSSFEAPVIIDSQEVFITASIGISITPEDSVDAQELINNADIAMYQAKQGGRNNYQFFSEDMNSEIQYKIQTEKEINEGINKEAFFLVYQPIFDLEQHQVCGVETAIEWQHKDNEIRHADEFIPIAENAGSIIPLGKWMLNQVVSDIRKLLKEGIKNINVSVNISPRQLNDRYFVSEVRALFAEHPNYIKYLNFEIGESCFVDQKPQIIGRIKELKEMGIGLVIDRFGAGYASMSYLKQVPADGLKIDQRYLNGLPENQVNTNFSNAIISMAHDLKLSVTADGVKNELQLAHLKKQGCDFAQGSVFVESMKFDALLDYLASPHKASKKASLN